MQIKYLRKQHESENVYTLFFRPENKFRYVPGQFVELTIKHPNPDSRGPKRWFTLSSNSLNEEISITTRQSDDCSTFKQRLFELRPGDSVECSTAMGDFVLPKDTSIPLVFIAVGIGVTPFRSMLGYLHESNNTDYDIQLLHSVKDVKDYPFKDDFKASPLKQNIAVSEFITVDMIKDKLEITNRTLIYLAGPEEVVEKLTKDLIASGIDKKQVVTDYFPGYGDN